MTHRANPLSECPLCHGFLRGFGRRCRTCRGGDPHLSGDVDVVRVIVSRSVLVGTAVDSAKHEEEIQLWADQELKSVVYLARPRLCRGSFSCGWVQNPVQSGTNITRKLGLLAEEFASEVPKQTMRT